MERLKKFRRALRKEDQELFDHLFDEAQMQVQGGVFASFPEPMVPILLSLLIAQEKRISALTARFQETLSPPPTSEDTAVPLETNVTGPSSENIGPSKRG